MPSVMLNAFDTQALEAAEQADDQKTLHQHLVKTKLCAYFSKGCCQWGDKCSFAHDQRELKNTPNLRKTRLCQAFEKGSCKHGTRCNFAHGKDELARADLFFKKTLCAWHEKGRCRNGERCCFAHGAHELRRQQGAAEELSYDEALRQYNQFKNKVTSSDHEKGEATNDVDSTAADSQHSEGYGTMEGSGLFTPTSSLPCSSPPGLPGRVPGFGDQLPCHVPSPSGFCLPQSMLCPPPGVFAAAESPAGTPDSMHLMPMKIHSSLCLDSPL